MDLLSFMRDHILILDGGMGTLLQSAGLRSGERPETWVLSHPDTVREIHRQYYAAGSHAVLTDTFGASLLHFDADTLRDIIFSAVRVAREAAEGQDAALPRFVGLDIGPSGKLLKPYGDLDFEDAVSLFGQTAELGEAAGADFIFIETMNDSYETKAALLAAREHTSLPVFVSNAYGSDGKLMTGAVPEAMVALLEGMGADAVGVNCSFGPSALAPVVKRCLGAASVPVLFKPNAGMPRVEDGRTVYDIGPEAFADEVARLVEGGVRICGGCCGTTPDHIRALARRVASLTPVPVVPKEHTVISSYTQAVRFGETPVLIGERINPTGKKRFKQALAAQDMDYLLREGLAQQEAGAHILDVNVGMPGIDEAAMLERAVTELQAVCDLPLQLDTSDPAAMARSLRRYNGKPLINSVSGKAESMQAIFPLQKKYGGVLICLTLDEHGIPDTAQGRVDIARRILAEAEACGIRRCDLIFDPLAMTVSSDPDAARVTLESVSRIRRELGCHVSLGVSNVSFGLPARDGVNAAFFALALEHGLDCAIMNPHSFEMMRTYYAYLALHGMDDHCMRYISYVQSHAPAPSASPSAPAPAASPSAKDVSPLQTAIRQGLRDAAAESVRMALADRKPLEIISEDIVPALNEVGTLFEEKRLFLPQLLMSAEAASRAFDVIRDAMASSAPAPERSRFVLATVRGDIHDIGKNIVRLLLESYGFPVTDLGKDVSPETILQAVLDLHAPLCGLSALMTTTVPAMEETVRLLHDKAPFCRVIVGGAVLTQEYADAMGADYYARDAMAAVRIAESLEQP